MAGYLAKSSYYGAIGGTDMYCGSFQSAIAQAIKLREDPKTSPDEVRVIRTATMRRGFTTPARLETFALREVERSQGRVETAYLYFRLLDRSGEELPVMMSTARTPEALLEKVRAVFEANPGLDQQVARIEFGEEVHTILGTLFPDGRRVWNDDLRTAIEAKVSVAAVEQKLKGGGERGLG